MAATTKTKPYQFPDKYIRALGSLLERSGITFNYKASTQKYTSDVPVKRSGLKLPLAVFFEDLESEDGETETAIKLESQGKEILHTTDFNEVLEVLQNIKERCENPKVEPARQPTAKEKAVLEKRVTPVASSTGEPTGTIVPTNKKVTLTREAAKTAENETKTTRQSGVKDFEYTHFYKSLIDSLNAVPNLYYSVRRTIEDLTNRSVGKVVLTTHIQISIVSPEKTHLLEVFWDELDSKFCIQEGAKLIASGKSLEVIKSIIDFAVDSYETKEEPKTAAKPKKGLPKLKPRKSN